MKGISRQVEAEVLTRSGGLCELCRSPGDFRGLQLHHKVLKGMGGSKHEYQAEELILLCAPCHSEQHGIRETRS